MPQFSNVLASRGVASRLSGLGLEAPAATTIHPARPAELRVPHVAHFGGQGSAYLPALQRLAREGSATCRRFIIEAQGVLTATRLWAELNGLDVAPYEPFGFDFGRWDPADAPHAGHCQARVSMPLIFVTQIATLLDAGERAEGGLDAALGRIQAAAGHSQGIAAALVVASASTRDELFELALRMAEVMFWLGMRVSEATEHEALGASAGAGAAVARWSHMLSVVGVEPALVERIVAAHNRDAEPDAHVSIAYRNGYRALALSGTPEALARLELSGHPAIADRSATLRSIPASAPFHSAHHLSGVSAQVAADLLRNGPQWRRALQRRLRCPVFDSSRVLSAATGTSPPLDLARWVVESVTLLPGDWVRTIHHAQRQGYALVDYGPDHERGAASLTRHVLRGPPAEAPSLTHSGRLRLAGSAPEPALGREQIIALVEQVAGSTLDPVDVDALTLLDAGVDSLALTELGAAIDRWRPGGSPALSVFDTIGALIEKVTRTPAASPPSEPKARPLSWKLRLQEFERTHSVEQTLDLYVEEHRALSRQRVYMPGGVQPRAMVKTPHHERAQPSLVWNANLYLGLHRDPRVAERVIDAVRTYGTGVGTSAWGGGMSDLHIEIERRLERWLDKEAVALFPTGYTANLGVLASLPKRPLLLIDGESHASIIDGCRMSGQDYYTFRHNDVDHLARKLEAYAGDYDYIVVIVESAYSMSGDLCPLREIVALKQSHPFYLYVDEAHSFGFYGGGRGYCHECGVASEVDFIFSTLSKATASIGGFVATSARWATYLRANCNTYNFQACFSPPDAAAVLAALDVIEHEPEHRERLFANAAYFRAGLRRIGFDLRESESPVVTIYVEDEAVLGDMYRALLEHRVYTTPVSYPVVPLGDARFRFITTAAHTREVIDDTLSVLAALHREYLGGATEQPGS